MTRTRWTSAAILILTLIATGLWSALRPNHPGPRIATGSPPVVEASPEDILKAAADLHSPLVLINFWASWCGPCKDEFPSLLKMPESFKAQNLKVILVSMDEPSDLSAAQTFLRQQGVDFPSFYKGSQSLNFLTQLFPAWSGSIPATVLLGKDLKLLDAWEGQSTHEEFVTRIQKQIKGS